jgi:Fanconi anemia group J protein
VETGAQWYESQAWRAVNQAIGRVIRHKNDWGAILFLDPRFKYPKNKLLMPKWVGGVVQEFDGYERAHVPLRLFMSNLSQNPPGGAGAAAARERASAPALAPVPPPAVAAASVHPFFAPFSTAAGKQVIELEYEKEEAPVDVKAGPKGTQRKKAKN